MVGTVFYFDNPDLQSYHNYYTYVGGFLYLTINTHNRYKGRNHRLHYVAYPPKHTKYRSVKLICSILNFKDLYQMFKARDEEIINLAESIIVNEIMEIDKFRQHRE